MVSARPLPFPSPGAATMALAALAAAILVASAPPSAYWGDSTEYLTTAFSLQVAHPNGYPLTALLGRLCLLLPLGSLAFRGHLLSVAAGCGLVALMVCWLRRRGLEWWGILPAAMLLFGRGTWFLFHLQEALTVNLLFVLAAVVLLVKGRETGGGKELAAAGFVVALGSGNHFQVLLLLPAVAWVAVTGAPGTRLRRLWVLAAGIMAGALIHLYLPLRSLPLLPTVYPQIGGPGDLLDYLQRDYYLVPSRTRGLAEAVGLLPELARTIAADYTVLFPLAAAGGVLALLRKSPEAALLLVGTVVLTAASALVNGPAGTTYKLDLYGAQAVLLLSPAVALGAREAHRFLGSHRAGRPAVVLIACATVAFLAGRAWGSWNLANYRMPERFGRLAISPGPSNALHFPAGDDPVNLGIHQGIIGAYDPSVAVIPVQGMTSAGYYARIAGWYPGLGLPPLETEEEASLASPELGERIAAAAAYLGRIPATRPGTILSLPVEIDGSYFGFRSLPSGPGHLLPGHAVAGGVAAAREGAWRRLEEEQAADRRRGLQFAVEIDTTFAKIRQRQAFDLLRAGRIDAAIELYRRADELFPAAGGKVFLGRALVLAGRFREAIDALGPGELPFPASAIRVQAVALSGDAAEALAMLQALTTVERETPEGVLASALVERGSGNLQAALSTLERGLVAHPGDPALLFARANLAMEGGLPEAEAPALEAFLVQFPGWDGSRLRLGVLYLAMAEAGKAETIFRELLAGGQTTASVWNNLGSALATQGKLAEASDAFRAALGLDPSYLPAARNLEQVAKQGGGR